MQKSDDDGFMVDDKIEVDVVRDGKIYKVIMEGKKYIKYTDPNSAMELYTDFIKKGQRDDQEKTN